MQKRLVHCWLMGGLIVLLLAAGGRVCAAENLIVNGSFEEYDAGARLPASWAQFKHDGEYTIEVVSDSDENRVISIAGLPSPNAGARAGVKQRTQPLTLAAKYEIRVKYKGQMLRSDVVAVIYATEGNVQLDSPKVFLLPAVAPEWGEYTFVYNIPAQLVGRTAAIEILLYGRGFGQIWYDDIVLKELAE